MQYSKVKSVAKQVVTKGPRLEKTILATMKTISDIVGGTLGPGGKPVLIERQEFDLPALVTKDGVTVFRSLGFDDAAAHVVMEAARDASVRTANEAGDGTTTATILAEAIVRKTNEFCKANPGVSPHKVVTLLEKTFKEKIEPMVRAEAILCNAENRDSLLRSVATISANGDTDLAEAVMKCYEIVGDEGNVTILEVSGPSSYEVEQIEGYSIGSGYEDSCAKFYQKFINDPATQRCVMEKPGFVLYHGRVTDIQTVIMLMEKIGMAWQAEGFNHNIVLVATGFSESVLGQLALNFAEPGTINVFPLLVPQSPVMNGQLEFIEDLSAVTGATIFDQMNYPLEDGELDDIGLGCRTFECNRFRSTVIGFSSEELIQARVDTLKKRLEKPESELERRLLEERIGKITGGIAKLKVIGASNGELREKRDRAEDAVCAVRGAIKNGCLPGGCWMLLKLYHELQKEGNGILNLVLLPALLEPFFVLLSNVGVTEEDTNKIWGELDRQFEAAYQQNNIFEFKMLPRVYDALNGTVVLAMDSGILDSVPAVLEALRNSLSIASLLGTLGGTVVYKRDTELERQEARDTNEFLRNAGDNPANERG